MDFESKYASFEPAWHRSAFGTKSVKWVATDVRGIKYPHMPPLSILVQLRTANTFAFCSGSSSQTVGNISVANLATTGTMSSRKSILVVGGGGKGPPAGGPPLPSARKASNRTPEDLKQTLNAIVQEAAEEGYNVRMIQIDPESQPSAGTDIVKTALASQAWDGFIIGNGIRSTPDLTVLFEQLVRIGREAAPDTPMGFNTHPLDIIETIERMFA